MAFLTTLFQLSSLSFRSGYSTNRLVCFPFVDIISTTNVFNRRTAFDVYATHKDFCLSTQSSSHGTSSHRSHCERDIEVNASTHRIASEVVPIGGDDAFVIRLFAVRSVDVPVVVVVIRVPSQMFAISTHASTCCCRRYKRTTQSTSGDGGKVRTADVASRADDGTSFRDILTAADETCMRSGDTGSLIAFLQTSIVLPGMNSRYLPYHTTNAFYFRLIS